MIRRYALAPVRGLMLFGLSLLGPPLCFAVVLGSSIGVMRVVELVRWLPNLCRRLALRWSDVDIPEPYRPPPPRPEPEPDGWYRHDDMLYKSPRTIIRMRRWVWLHSDPATYRDEAWMVLNPLVGGALAVLPAALVLGGLVLPFLWTGWALPIGLTMITLGLAAGPHLLRLHGRWSRVLLAPTTRTGRHPAWEWIRSRGVAAGNLGATTGWSFVGLGLAVLHILSIYPGFLWPWQQVLLVGRQYTGYRRGTIHKWTGIEVPSPYLPAPPPPQPRPDGTYRVGRALHKSLQTAERMQRLTWSLKDRGTWRDLGWLLLDPLVAVLLSAVSLVTVFGVFFGLIWLWLWSLLVWPLFRFDPWWAFRPIVDVMPTPQPLPLWVGAIVAVAAVLLGLAVAPPLLRLHGKWSRLLLKPTKAAILAKRVERLTKSRTEATDAQAAELRRIERDLHDGAQARLVSMGMHLGAVEQLIDRDPDAAKQLVAKAKENSAKALLELRELVRGIHPPVLAERGLGDAIRAIALDSPLAVEVSAELPPQGLEAPVESAAYFALCELLTNAAKHARAKRVAIDLRYTNGTLRITTTDDGHGGANPASGGGLRGIQRRLATFDGTLALSSPAGGPTTATMEIPCALSSPRTSTSSETA